jgi:hypothetical protein
MESSLLLSVQDLSSEMANRYNHRDSPSKIEQVINQSEIEVFGPTGYGPHTRVMQLVCFGHDLFGLNTENNVREVLGRYFRSHNYETTYEFDDESGNERIFSKPYFSMAEVKHKKNGRDFLAVKSLVNTKDMWLVELKGHSGEENWDFFEGFKQLIRLIDMRNRVQHFSRLTQSSGATIRCAIGFPSHEVKAHKGKPCYGKELERLEIFLNHPDAFEHYSAKLS